jgi:hypothetical protein
MEATGEMGVIEVDLENARELCSLFSYAYIHVSFSARYEVKI